MTTKVTGDWLAAFRVMGELKHSCDEAEESLNLALTKVLRVSEYLNFLDTILKKNYNFYESKETGRGND